MLKPSHISFRVNCIQDAYKTFSECGFTVQWGSNPQKAHNAIIWFDEGPFIELFQFPRIFRPIHYVLRWTKGKGAGDRWRSWSDAKEGWCDLALEPIEKSLQYNLKAIRSKLIAQNIECSKIVHGKRVRPDGQSVRYQVLAPLPNTLPFIVSAYDPPQRPQKTKHKNGAIRISQICTKIKKSDFSKFNFLSAKDPLIQPIPSSESKIQKVVIEGLKVNENAENFINKINLHSLTKS